MKKSIFTLLIFLLPCVLARSQGNFWFYNYGGGLDAPVRDQSGNPIMNSTGIYQATAAWAVGFDQSVQSLQPVSGLAENFVGFGYFLRPTPVALPGTTIGEQVTLVFRAWDTRTGATWDSASVRGQSNPFNYTLFGGIDPGSGPSLGAFSTLPQAFSLAVVPEPASGAVLVFFGSLGLFCRKAGKMSLLS